VAGSKEAINKAKVRAKVRAKKSTLEALEAFEKTETTGAKTKIFSAHGLHPSRRKLNPLNRWQILRREISHSNPFQ
jgi:hypothetical protein